MATPTLVRHANHRVGTGSSSNSINYTGDAGNGLIVLVNINAIESSCSISDTLGNIWQTIFSIANGATNGNAYLAAFYCQTLNSSVANTIKVVYAAATSPSTVFIAEFSGLGVFDQAATIRGSTSNSTTASTNSAAPSGTGDLAVAFVGDAGFNISFSSWTNSFVQGDALSSSPSSAWAYKVLSGVSSTNAAVTLSTGTVWSALMLLFRPVGIFLADSAAAAIASSITANSACVATDLIVSQFQLSNVGAGDSGFSPTISDTVNSGNYTVQFKIYYAAGTKIYGYAYKAATASGTPVVSVTANAAFSGGEFNYIRLSGFTAVPTLDVASGNTSGTVNPMTGSITPNGINEAILQLLWNTSGGSVAVTPSGWNFIANASGAGLIDPFWQENASLGAISFSANNSISAPWYSATIAFSSGSALLINAASSTYSMTGNVANFSLSQLIPFNLLANPGAFDWVGTQSQTQANIYSDVGAFSLAGSDATFQNSTGAAFTLAATFGAFAIGGQAAVLQTQTYVMPEFTGFFSMLGLNANLLVFTPAQVPVGYEVLPNLVGLDWLTASAVLYFGGYAELQPSVVAMGGTQEQGFVIGQTPAPYAQVPLGCAVQLTIGADHIISVAFEAR